MKIGWLKQDSSYPMLIVVFGRKFGVFEDPQSSGRKVPHIALSTR